MAVDVISLLFSTKAGREIAKWVLAHYISQYQRYLSSQRCRFTQIKYAFLRASVERPKINDHNKKMSQFLKYATNDISIHSKTKRRRQKPLAYAICIFNRNRPCLALTMQLKLVSFSLALFVIIADYCNFWIFFAETNMTKRDSLAKCRTCETVHILWHS